jgi:hypothetical protein
VGEIKLRRSPTLSSAIPPRGKQSDAPIGDKEWFLFIPLKGIPLVESVRGNNF